MTLPSRGSGPSTPNTGKRLGENIERVRGALGYSQSALARRVGTSQSAVSQIESGERNPSFGMLLSIKHALGAQWTVLLRGIE